MKITNRIISMTLCVLLISAIACLSVSAATYFPVGDWVYEKINNNTEFEIHEYNGTLDVVYTPYSHNGLKITSVGSSAFSGNEVVTGVYLTENVYSVADHAFLNCTNLETIKFLGDVTNINASAFAGCSSLSNINLDDTSIAFVAGSCFMNCDSLTEVTLPDTVATIYSNAFAYCDNLSKIVIPASVTTIADDAFYNSDNVVIYCYENSAAHTYAVDNSIDFVLIEDEPVQTYMIGDTDGTDDISILDATLIQIMLVSAETEIDFSDIRARRGDANLDGVLSITDATKIQIYLLEEGDIDSPIGDVVEY